MLSILRPFQILLSYLFSFGSAPIRDERFPPGKDVVIQVEPVLQVYRQPTIARKVAAAPLPYTLIPQPIPEALLLPRPLDGKARG